MCKFDSVEAFGYGKVTDTLRAWITLITSPLKSDQNSSVYMAGSTFGVNNGGFQQGNAYSAGMSPVNNNLNFHSNTKKE
jgi:hypothetical protein